MEARIFPAHFIPHFVLDQSYAYEAKARIGAYKKRQAQKDGKEVLPLIRGVQAEFNPSSWALKFKHEEEARNNKIDEDVKRECRIDEERLTPIQSVTPRTRYRLYDGVSNDLEGRYRYLSERKNIIPEKRVPYPWTCSMDYGWKLTDNQTLYNKPSYARLSTIENSFYGRNGIPKLQQDMPTMKLVSNRYM